VKVEVHTDHLEVADLQVGDIYCGGPLLREEPIHRLMRTGNQGGIRQRNNHDGSVCLITLLSTSQVVEWPNEIDGARGFARYFGDNRLARNELHDTPGNRVFGEISRLNLLTRTGRAACPPIFLFSSAPEFGPRSVRFDGLAVPGYDSAQLDWCVAKWFLGDDGEKFINYEIALTLLADGVISRSWLDGIVNGEQLGNSSPWWFKLWVETGDRVAMTRR